MRNLFILCVITCTVMACVNEHKAKVYQCSEYSVGCELMKDNILVLPVIFDPKTIDVYGNSITGRSNCQWYTIVRKTKLMIPVSFHVCTGYQYIGDGMSMPIYSECPTAQQINNCVNEWKKMVRADSTDLSMIVPGLTKAIVVVSGPNEILTEKACTALAFAEKKEK